MAAPWPLGSLPAAIGAAPLPLPHHGSGDDGDAAIGVPLPHRGGGHASGASGKPPAAPQSTVPPCYVQSIGKTDGQSGTLETTPRGRQHQQSPGPREPGAGEPREPGAGERRHSTTRFQMILATGFQVMKNPLSIDTRCVDDGWHWCHYPRCQQRHTLEDTTMTKHSLPKDHKHIRERRQTARWVRSCKRAFLNSI